MTDKQIIINGVDVSGCDFLTKEDDYCSYSGEYRAYKGQCGCSDEEMCKNHPNCFYKKALKQLKRKEQECKALREKKEYTDMACEQFKKQLQSKEQKCEQLKAEFDKKELIFAGIETSNKLLIEKNNKLKQTLIEIKELCKRQDLNQGSRCIQILQKISEVENEN